MTDEVDPLERMADEVVRAYDLSVEERWVRRPLPTLDIVNERFLRNLRQGMFQFVRRTVDIEIEPVTVQRFGDFIGALTAGVSYNILGLQPLRGNGLVVCGAGLVRAMVDVLYGGTGNAQTSDEEREFSPTEQRVIQRLMGVLCSTFNKAWAEIYPLESTYLRSETHAQFANVAAPSEMVVLTTLQLTVGAFRGAIHICKPYSVLEPIRDVLYGPQQANALAQDRRWVSMLMREIQAAEVTLVAELARPELTVGQLLTMKPGDFIGLERSPQVFASVEGTQVFACHYGTHNARYALRIEECLRGADPHWLGGSHVR